MSRTMLIDNEFICKDCGEKSCSSVGGAWIGDDENRYWLGGSCLVNRAKSVDGLRAELEAAKARIEELAKAEKTATMAMVYLAGQLATKEKMSPDWIQEAIRLAEKEIEKGGDDA